MKLSKNSNVIIYTHDDLDGIGCAILGEMAFSNIKVNCCSNSNIDRIVKNDLENDVLDNADFIYITDICPTQEVLDILPTNISSKTLVLDHHSTRKSLGDIYSYVKIITEQFGRKSCGTSLFYQYLTENNLLERKECTSEFCELVRQYDTWEWTVNNNMLPNDLNILWLLKGNNNFSNETIKKLNNSEHFEFSESEKAIVREYKINHQIQVEKYANEVVYGTLNGFKCGLVKAEDEYKNDISGELKKRKSNIDFLAVEVPNKQTLSLRTVNLNFDLKVITDILGGGGRSDTASCPKNSFYEYFNPVKEIAKNKKENNKELTL